MSQNRRRPTGTLLLAGLAAYAYYKYTKMSEDEKRSLVGNLKEKGKKFYDENVPENVKSMFGKVGGSMGSANNNFSGTANNTASGSRFGEGSDYTG